MARLGDKTRDGEGFGVTSAQHGVRVGLLMVFAAILLGWLSAHTAILFADGLRYIEQAQRIDQGSWLDGIFKAVDHPIYPLAVAAAHRGVGGEGPLAWQAAAQTVSLLAGVLLVIPLYLVSLELFGPRSAWLSCVLVYLAPLYGHVFGDVLSESTFLLFWMWGLWSALKFLKEGTFGWLPLTIGFGGLAYLSRPEGLLLPAALVATLAAMPLLPATRMNWPRWWAAVAFLVIGPAILVGPYVAAKGGLGTKPAIARLLGTAPKSDAKAVERARPLDPNQSTAKTYALATRAMLKAVRDAVTVPLLPLVFVGLWSCRPFSARARSWLFVSIIVTAASLALIRLHATGGYCTPRHAMVLGLLLIPAAAAGLDHLLNAIKIPGWLVGQGEERFRVGPAAWVLTLAAYVAWMGGETFAPINAGFVGYRDAGNFLAETAQPGQEIVDVTGWSLFYGGKPGYTFANLIEADPANPNIRWIVARDAHLKGPWIYCDQLRSLVAGLEPVKTYPEFAQRGQARIYVFDRQAKPRTATAEGPDVARR